jgi:hypothetical protein
MTYASQAERANLESLQQAVRRYFDLMYDFDVASFDGVFRSTARLHGLRNGEVRMLTAEAYKEILATTPSPRSQHAPRQEEILLIDVTSGDQALAKVRVRIGSIVYVDYLSYHHIDGEWFITSKAFHIESNAAA